MVQVMPVHPKTPSSLASFRDVYSRKTQANRRTIVHQSCSLYNNNKIIKNIIEVTKTTSNLGKIRKNKEKGETCDN